MNIRPNRVKQRLAAGQVATILAGTNDPDLIDQLGPLHPDGIWLEGEHGGVDYADLGNLTVAPPEVVGGARELGVAAVHLTQLGERPVVHGCSLASGRPAGRH